MLFSTSIITLLSLLVYLVLIINVGRARGKYNVQPPATTGDPNFERALRVQQNMLEQLILFLPSLWLFSFYVAELWGTVLGGFWIVGRILYAYGYYQAAEKRRLGFAISSLSGIVLLLGTLIVLIYSGFQSLSLPVL